MQFLTLILRIRFWKKNNKKENKTKKILKLRVKRERTRKIKKYCLGKIESLKKRITRKRIKRKKYLN
jgi:hypothetical protein